MSQLTLQGHRVRVLALHEGSDEVAAAAASHAHDHGYTIEVVAPDFKTGVQRLWSSAVRPRRELAQSVRVNAALERLVSEDHDLLVASGITTPGWLDRYARTVLELHFLTAVDSTSIPGDGGIGARQKLRRLQDRRAERALLRFPGGIVVNSDRVARLIRERSPKARVMTAPLTIDSSLYQCLGPSKDLVVGFIGSMFWEPSRAAAIRLITSVWPRIRARVPNASLLVAGWDATRYLGHLFPVPGAELLGAVSDPPAFFSRISVLVFPGMRGTGMKIKTLEAMAYGIPVVTTAEGVEGLEQVPGSPPCVPDDDDALAAAAAHLLIDRAARDQVSSAGREAMVTALAPGTITARFIEVVQAAI